MTRTRWMAVIAVAALVAVGGVAVAVTGGGSSHPSLHATPTTSTTATGATTSSSAPATSTTAGRTTQTTVDDGSLHIGSQGAAVTAVQQRLIELHYDPGPADGNFGQATAYAVEAFQKLNGMAPSGRVNDAAQAALANPAPVNPLVPNGGPDRTEVDLTHQVLYLYKGGALRLITHVSTGSGQRYCDGGYCRNAITPIGSFRYSWRSAGWRQAPLGRLYNPVYFTSDGVAVHGALSVPTYPASHGCVRIPMHIAEYFPSLVNRGDPVYVTDGRAVGPPPASPAAPPPPDKPTTPGDDTTSTTTSSSTSTTSTSTTTTTTPTTSSSTTTTPTLLP